jgi:uncharacterized protein (TIGR02453 family)
MITKQTLDFLALLKQNNTREWFTANRKSYDSAKKEVENFILRLIPEIAKLDPSIGTPELKDCFFRINRDIRFSPDKSPYKTHFGVFIARGGRKSICPGYYVHIEPGSSILAGGVYVPRPEVLKLLRNEIYFNSTEFIGIITDKNFLGYFGKIDEFDKLKKPPKDFPADFPAIDLLKYRSYTVVHTVSDQQVTAGDYAGYALEVFRAMLPLHRFLNRAIANG